MLLGIDIGTSKSAAAVVGEDGAVAVVASVRHGADRPAAPDRAEQEATALIDSAWAAVAQLPRGLRARVRAAGFTGQMHGVVLLDGRGVPLTPLINWQDRRALEPGFLESLHERTGYRLHSGFGGATLAWLRRHGAWPGDAASAATIHDLAAARLCGLARPPTDPTDAASWGLFDLDALDWDRAAVAAAGIPTDALPTVVPCGTRIGAATAAMAGRLGIPAGVPVTAALGDNQASLVAVLREPDRELVLTLGTGGQIAAVLPAGARTAPGERSGRWECRPYPGGRWAAVGAVMCGGAAWQWLAEYVESWLRELGLEAPPRDDLYARLNDLGLAATDAPTVRPHFMGERHEPGLRGAIDGLTMSNASLGALAKGLARGIMESLRELAPPEMLAGRTRLVGTGNALRRNPLLRETAQEVFGLPFMLRDVFEEAAVGAALHAGRSTDSERAPGAPSLR
jgi:sedoheptulokinase